MKNITIIGGGNLGAAIALGIQKAQRGTWEVLVTGRKAHRLEKLTRQGLAVSTDNIESVRDSDWVILCVQPTQVAGVLEEIKPVLKAGQHTLVSTATGVSIAQLETMTGPGFHWVRAMPNTASAIGESITCLSSPQLDEQGWSFVDAIFGSIGTTLRIDEPLMQAATVLGASGIAFFMRYLRAMTQGGIQMGFHPGEAQAIAVQTAVGAAKLIQAGGTHPEEEIDKVTTPRGCTITGLNEMEHQGLSSAVIKGIMASYEKINEMK